jgi:hypothetical protein
MGVDVGTVATDIPRLIQRETSDGAVLAKQKSGLVGRFGRFERPRILVMPIDESMLLDGGTLQVNERCAPCRTALIEPWRGDTRGFQCRFLERRYDYYEAHDRANWPRADVVRLEAVVLPDHTLQAARDEALQLGPQADGLGWRAGRPSRAKLRRTAKFCGFRISSISQRNLICGCRSGDDRDADAARDDLLDCFGAAERGTMR